MKKVLRRFGLELRKYQPPEHREFVSLKSEESRRGVVLLAYIVEPFLNNDDKGRLQGHTHYAESLTIADAFLTMGYDVDVIDYRNRDFRPSRSYDFFVSARTHFARISERLNSDCIKIAHLETAHFLFNNAAAFSRLLEMQRRRNAAAWSLRVIEKNWAPEHADYLAIIGNEFTLSTYRYAGKKMFNLPVPTPSSYASPENKDFESVRNRFLWLGSGGLVHKGLDLTLEAFSGLPNHHLTVCGPIDAASEKEFRDIYSRELYETENIDTVGWIDVNGPEFLEIAANCAGLIYPSSSEGQSGAVVTAMQAGLIPVISYQSGVDVEDFGSILDDCSIEEISEAVLRLSSASAPELKERAMKTWHYAREHNSHSRYLSCYQDMIRTILSEGGE